jgi:hypothetical protein
MGVKKQCVARGGKKYNFQKGGGGPKYRPLRLAFCSIRISNRECHLTTCKWAT